MYIRKDKIPQVWPLFGSTSDPANIEKFENYGTYPVSTLLAIADAIRFHETIGGRRKEERLRYLKNSWAEAVADHPRITVNTPLDRRQSCAIATVAIEGMNPTQLWDTLYDRYGIFTVGVPFGARVAPNLHNTLAEVRQLAQALQELAG
jgi:selenocysteine lyase/cysteine desulfurase